METRKRSPYFATKATDTFVEGRATHALSEDGSAPNSAPQRKQRRNVGRLSPGSLTPVARQQIASSGLVDVVEPKHSAADLIISPSNYRALAEVVLEVRRAEDLRRHGLHPRSKLLLCGPPGCGKTLCAEVLAHELRLPFLVARLDGIITTYLGETASNLRKIFDAAAKQPVLLFLDEFDAIARTRTDVSEHNEIRRVVNSLLMMIDSFSGKGLLVAATNLQNTLDQAVWRRFDEVVLFDLPTARQIGLTLQLKLRNCKLDFDPADYVEPLQGMSFAEIERICLTAIKATVLDRAKSTSSKVFDRAILSEKRRVAIRHKVSAA